MTNTNLHLPTIVEVQAMVRELIKSKVCELESQAAVVANDMPAYAKQLAHAARELDSIQIEVLLLLNETMSANHSSLVFEHEGHVPTPSLPQLTPLSPVEVMAD